jgi:hypothetical protein
VKPTHKKDLKFFTAPDQAIAETANSKILRYVQHVSRMWDTINVYTILVGNLLIKVYVEDREMDGWIILRRILLPEVLAQDLVR